MDGFTALGDRIADASGPAASARPARDEFVISDIAFGAVYFFVSPSRIGVVLPKTAAKTPATAKSGSRALALAGCGAAPREENFAIL